MNNKNLPLPTCAAMLFLALAAFSVPVVSTAQTSFFQGKTITIVQGRDPGGTGDLRVRALVPFLQKYIPGNPTIVMEFMPGGGSRKGSQSRLPIGSSRRADHRQFELRHGFARHTR